jgi:hypothetical protein
VALSIDAGDVRGRASVALEDAKIAKVFTLPVPVFTGAMFVEITALPVEVAGSASAEAEGREWKTPWDWGSSRGAVGLREFCGVLIVFSIVNENTHFVETKMDGRGYAETKRWPW